MPTTKIRPLPAAAQELLDALLADEVDMWHNGDTFIAGHKRGAQRARAVGRQVRSLQTRGLLTASRRPLITDAGLRTATVTGDRAAIERAYRLRTAPPSVLRSEPLGPEPVRDAPEPRRAVPRDGYVTATLTERVTPDSYGEHDHWDVDVVLNVHGGLYPKRHGVTFVGPDAVARREHMGPLLRGVYAGAYGLAIVIDQHGGTAADMVRDRAAGRVFDVRIGDVVDIRGWLFVIEPAPNDNIRLTRMDLGGQP